MLHTRALQLETKQAADPTALGAARDLFAALDRAGVRYCHWKSNVRLAKSLEGRTDFDLLVDRADGDAFRQALAQQGVKPLAAAPGRAYPAVENHLGFDAASGRLFHLHVHTQLVLGEQFVKNYRLPVEEHFLKRTHLQDGVRVPLPEFELAVLCLRALLKYRDRDALKDVLGIRSPGLPAAIRDEIAYLRGQASAEALEAALGVLVPAVPTGVVREFLRVTESEERPGAALYRLRRQARAALRPYQRTPRWLAALRYRREAWRRSHLRRGAARKMAPASGGLEVAVVGIDGAGKSTMSRLLGEWLAWKLDAHVHYLGSKQPSRRSELAHLLFRAARRAQRAAAGAVGERSVLARALAALREGALRLHHLSVGLDRLASYQAGRRQAAAGSVVIYDRFPLRAPLDGPRIEGTGDGLQAALARLEAGIYGRFRLPDVMLVLEIEPAEAHRRKRDHDRAAIEAKARALAGLTREIERGGEQTAVIRIDAGQSAEAVLSQLKAALWQWM